MLLTAGKRVLRRLGLEVKRVRPVSVEGRFCDYSPFDVRSAEPGSVPNRALIITQPKAGTYLVAEILKQAGLYHTHLHLGRDQLQAYEPFDLESGIQRPDLFNVRCPIEQSRNLLRFGQLAVSHLPYDAYLAKLLSGFKIIHVKRELRSSIVSLARMYLYSETKGRVYKARILRHGASGVMKVKGKQLIQEALSINHWTKSNNVLTIKMEDLISSPSLVIHEMISHLHLAPAVTVREIWTQAGGAATLTKSGRYPELKWTDSDETLFRKIGGLDANSVLGYVEGD